MSKRPCATLRARLADPAASYALKKQLQAQPLQTDGHGEYWRELQVGDVVFETGWHQCVDCAEVYPPMFMVLDELWAAYAHKEDMLCRTCFESRLGRRLTRADLQPGVRVNRLLTEAGV